MFLKIYVQQQLWSKLTCVHRTGKNFLYVSGAVAIAVEVFIVVLVEFVVAVFVVIVIVVTVAVEVVVPAIADAVFVVIVVAVAVEVVAVPAVADYQCPSESSPKGLFRVQTGCYRKGKELFPSH